MTVVQQKLPFLQLFFLTILLIVYMKTYQLHIQKKDEPPAPQKTLQKISNCVCVCVYIQFILSYSTNKLVLTQMFVRIFKFLKIIEFSYRCEKHRMNCLQRNSKVLFKLSQQKFMSKDVIEKKVIYYRNINVSHESIDENKQTDSSLRVSQNC